jgi:capsular polysaccharide biosynthesis protein
VIDPSTDPPYNERRQGEADSTWGDRPGIVASLLRYRVVIVAATLLGAVAGYGIAQLLPVRYQAEAVLILSDPGGPSVLGGSGALGSSDRKVYLDKQSEIMTSSAVLGRALQLLGSSQSVTEVRNELDVKPSANLASVSIAATSADPQNATALANAVGTAYEQVTQARATTDANAAIASLEKLRARYQADLDSSPRSAGGELTSHQQQLAGQLADIQQREQDITTQVGAYASGVEYFEKADRPTSPSQPKPALVTALGALVGLLGAAAWAWWKAARDQRVEDRSEPARILDAPLLGQVPRLRALSGASGTAVTPRTDPALEDAYRLILTSMEHELTGVDGKSVAVTSVGPGDDKTSAALQIARAASQENRRILLIDADARTRHLSERVGAAQSASSQSRHQALMELREGASVKAYLRRLVSTDGGSVLPIAPDSADPEHPTDVYRPVDVRDAVRAIGDLFDLVLVDAPALLASASALDVAGQADGVVLVVPHRVTVSELREARDRLAFVKSPLIGYVYVRSAGPDARTRWERIARPGRRSSAGNG